MIGEGPPPPRHVNMVTWTTAAARALAVLSSAGSLFRGGEGGVRVWERRGWVEVKAPPKSEVETELEAIQQQVF